jgi:hypothetical protein
MDLIERIGAFLGLAAFGGLGVLALLYFQQGREVRRLRDWAGKAPERSAAAAAEAETALAPPEPREEDAGPGLGTRMRARWDGWTARLPRGIGEHLPAPIYLGLIALAAIVIGVGVATSGFGLFGSEESAKDNGGPTTPAKIEVAVLNSTGVTGLGAEIGDDVKKAGYDLGKVGDVGTPFESSVVMFSDGNDAEAKQVAGDVSKQLGKTDIDTMTEEVANQAQGAKVAVVIGQDDAG